MITADGYSKDNSIVPEAIVITMGQNLVQLAGGLKNFIARFEQGNVDGSTWVHKLRNKPGHESRIQFVYVIIANRLAYRCDYLGYSTEPIEVTGVDGNIKTIDFPHIHIGGNVVKCPFKRTLRGFRGFRYSTILF